MAIKIGDKIIIHNKADNVAIKAGYYTRIVIKEEEKSIVVDNGFGAWWFYRDTRESYVGDANIV